MALAMQQQADVKRKQRFVLFEVYGALNPRSLQSHNNVCACCADFEDL